jgi:hypothetical protein
MIPCPFLKHEVDMTLGDLIGKITDDLIDVRVSQVQIMDAINESIDYYKRMNFYFTNLVRTFDVKAGQEFYKSTDFTHIDEAFNIDYMTLTIGGQSWEVDAVLDSQIQDAQNSGSTNPLTNAPYAYAAVRMGIRFFPIPSDNGTATYSASEKTLTLTGTAQTNTWLTEAPELIRAAAKVRIALNKFNNADLAQGPAAMEAKELAALQAETRKRQAQVKLKIDAGLLPKMPSFYNVMRG